MTSKDPYQILGLSRQATPEEIRRAYRRLAKQCHPDRNPGDPGAAQRFKEVHAAYEVLGDPHRRAQYDRFGAGGPRPEFHTWGAGRRGGPAEEVSFDFGGLGDLTSIFEQFFSRGASLTRPRAGRAAAGPDLEHELELSLEECLAGTVRTVVLNGTAGGPERIDVRIPAGVRDGQRIRVRGRGQVGPGGRGNLIIRCRIRPHPLFRREGLDLLADLPLTFPQAVLGAKVEVPTPAGPARVTVPPGTSSGTKLRLRGRGVREARTGQQGDLLAVVRIQAPRDLSPRARALLQELERELAPQPQTNPAS